MMYVIVVLVILPALPGAKKKHMVLSKWQVRALIGCVSSYYIACNAAVVFFWR
jgi:hypothetical protein